MFSLTRRTNRHLDPLVRAAYPAPMNDFPIAEEIGHRGGMGTPPLFFYCDHATNAIPPDYGGLGLAPHILETHIAWDIGAGALTRALSAAFDAPGLLCGFSRLLIDPNRSLDRADLLMEVSDGIEIPGNRDTAPGERHRRIRHFFEPYHERLDYALDMLCQNVGDPLIVSVHSFTRRLNTERQDRPWQVGVLWNHDPETARRFIGILRAQTDFQIGDNQPYSALEFNYSVDRHVASRRLRHLTLEIRQDLVADTGGVTAMAGLLIDALSILLGDSVRRPILPALQ